MDGEYPNAEELQAIESWGYRDFIGLMDCVKDLWKYSDCGYWKQIKNKYYLSTGGWSGNEDIIMSLKQNVMFWSCCWLISRRGGHYVFEVKEYK